MADKQYVCIVGLDDDEAAQVAARLDVPNFYRVTLPGITVQDGQLWVETESRPRYVPVSRLIYHAIYEDDLDFITGLCFWGGPVLPNPRAMLDLRVKLPGLVRALEHTRFNGAGITPRGFASARTAYPAARESVAKWGNWHCGENKERFGDQWRGDEAAVIEPFISGQAVRVVIIGEGADAHVWQIHLQGDTWLKSIHDDRSAFMPIDDELLTDTRHVQAAFGLQVIANDYMVAEDGHGVPQKYLLEVNHVPNVSHFPDIWAAYLDYSAGWLQGR